MSKKFNIFPFVFISPELGFNISAITFNKVVFPEPFGPMTPTHSPLLTFKLMFFKA